MSTRKRLGIKTWLLRCCTEAVELCPLVRVSEDLENVNTLAWRAAQLWATYIICLLDLDEFVLGPGGLCLNLGGDFLANYMGQDEPGTTEAATGQPESTPF